MRKDLHFDIDLTLEPRYTKEFVVKQKDSVNLFINLKSNGAPISVVEQTARLYVRKPDSSIVVQGGTDELGDKSIILDANTVIVELKNSALNTTGLCYAELELEDERGTLITQTFIFEVVDRITNTEEAIKAVDDIYLLGEIEKFIIQAKIDMALLKEQIAEGLIKINEFNEFVVTKSEELQSAIEIALQDIEVLGNHFTTHIKESSENYLSNITGLGESYGIQIERMGEEYLLNMAMKADEILNNIREQGSEGLNAIIEAKDGALSEIRESKTIAINEVNQAGATQTVKIRTLGNQKIEEIKAKGDEVIANIEIAGAEVIEAVEQVEAEVDEALEAIDEAKANSIFEINNTKDESISAVEEAKTNAIEEIGEAKTDAIDTINTREEEIIEGLNNITIDGTQLLEDGIKKAEKRLQEQTIQSLWEVQEKSSEEQDNLVRVSREQQSAIRLKANEEIERVNQAGEHISNMASTLEGNIEDGLNQINSTINTGKNEIDKLSREQLDKIREEGSEITEMVQNIESITGEHIQRIQNTGQSVRESIKRTGSNERSEINTTASDRRTEINELADEKLEAIGTAGDEKLEEINNILGVSKGEVEELLELTREEIQTHRVDISTTVNLGKDEINTLKNNSINEMNTRAEELVEEVMNAEITLKNDFTELAEGYKTQINELGSVKVEALQDMIDRIDELEEAVAESLANNEERAENIRENFDNIFESTDAKMAEIRPILNDLNEIRSLCDTLINQNKIASQNSETLDYLHTESDTRIVELRRLIELAKHYEEVVTKFIDARGGNHEEIEARLLALEESLVLINETLSTLENIYATKAEVEANYTTKKELKTAIEDAMKNTGLRVVGKLGAGLKMATELMPPILSDLKTPEHLIDTFGEVKHSYVYEMYPTNGKQTFYKILFFCDLDNPKNTGKYVSYNNGVFTFNGLEKDKDFAFASTTSTFGDEPFSTSSIVASVNHNHYRTYSYYMDFNLYDENGEEILVNNPKKAGVNNLNEATTNGFYILDMDMNSYQELSNAPMIDGSIAKGYLQVVGNTQTLFIVDGQTFTREIGGAWSRIDNKAIAKNTIASIGKSTELKAPELFKTVPANLKAFYNEPERTVMFRKNETEYCVLRINRNATANLTYTNTYVRVPSTYAYYSQLLTYNTTTEAWTIKKSMGVTSIDSEDISININYFEVYHSDFDITSTVHSMFNISKGTAINYSAKETLDDFNKATQTGIYRVDIEDDVLNAPTNNIKGVLDVKVVEGEIYQELKLNNNKTVYLRIFKDNKWGEWINVGNEYVGVIGVAQRITTDKKGVFSDVPAPPRIIGSEYIGKYMISYLNSSKPYYVCAYLYKNLMTGKTPYLSSTIYTSDNGQYAYIRAYDTDSSTYKAFVKYETDTEWGSGTFSNLSDTPTYNIHHSDFPIYTGETNKDGVYREADNANVISNLDGANREGKYYVNVKANELEQIQNMPPIKIEKDLETTLYVNIEGEKVLQQITIEGITYTRRIGEAWTGVNNSFVKNDVLAHIEGVEVNATDYEIETANIEDIFASCPAINNHKQPNGVIDFADSSGRYYRWLVYGKNSGFYYNQNSTGSTKYIGAFAYSQAHIQRFTYSNGAWTELAYGTSSTAYLYQSVGADGKIIACDIDVCLGSSYSAWDKNTIYRKADVKDAVKVINDFNEATRDGLYKVNILENTEALNTPVVGALKGNLEVFTIEDVITQRFIDNSGTYTRNFFNEAWSEWTSGGLSEEDTAKVEGVINKVETIEDKFKVGKLEIAPKFEWDVPPDTSIYSNLPVPSDYKSVFCGKLGTYFMVAFFNREIEAELVLDSNGNQFMKVKDYKFSDVIGSYYRSGSSWAKEGQNYVDKYYGGVTGSGYFLTACYYNDFKIFNPDGTLYKDSYLNKDLVGDGEDFNDATVYNVYQVIQENEILGNSPIDTAFSGVLEVIKADDLIKQELTTADKKVFSRVFDGAEWTEWKEAITGIDEETVDAKIDEAISSIDIPEVDLSDYTTASTVEEMIYAMLGVPKAQLINDLNDIIRGI